MSLFIRKKISKDMLSARGSTVMIRIKRTLGRPFVISASRNDTILSIKERITAKTGLYPYQQRLVFRGKVLIDEISVGFYTSTSNPTMYLAPIKEDRSVNRKPEMKLERLIYLTNLLTNITAEKYFDTVTEMKELIEDPILIAYSRINDLAMHSISMAQEALETIERPPSHQLENYVAKTTDYALSLVEAAPDGLRILQSFIEDTSSEEEPYSISPTVTNYQPKIMSKPLPYLKGYKNVLQTSAYRTLQTRKESQYPLKDSSTSYLQYNDNSDTDDILEFAPQEDFDQSLSQKFAPQVEILKNMGFKDEHCIIKALGETNGNVQKAAKLLQNKFFSNY